MLLLFFGFSWALLIAPNGKRETLKVTSEHPFFVKGKGWTEVRKLTLGDQIISGKGGFLAIADMRSESQPTLVYNFEVAQNHNYFAGGEGALVHNAKSGTSGENSAAKIGRQKHGEYKINNPNFERNFKTGNGFADAVDLVNGVVCELKPNSPRAIARGWRQLDRYAKALEAKYGRPFTKILDTY